MAIHLLVVAEYDPSDLNGRAVHPAAELAQQTDTFKMVRCSSPRDLVETVRQVAVSTRQLIDILDLYGHAHPGSQSMGDGVLFDNQGTGRLIARALRPLLTTDARVRLLGCLTALYPEGQQLLGMLRQEFGGSVVVYGTIDSVDADTTKIHEFDERGFKKQKEDMLLFSSTEALVRLAPDRPTRGREHSTWVSTLRCRTCSTKVAHTESLS